MLNFITTPNFIVIDLEEGSQEESEGIMPHTVVFLKQPILNKLILTVCKLSYESNKRLLRYCILIISMSCRIGSVTSHLSENEAKNLQNGDIHLPQILALKRDISRTIWSIEVTEGSFCYISYPLSFEINLYFDRSFSLI